MLNEPTESEKGRHARAQNNGTGVPFSGTRENKINEPMRESPLKISLVK
jgi:hypothetical protein